MASSEKKTCHYEILGVDRECLIEEIRSAYKKLALQRHPDKLVKTGIPLDQATASFQELVNAYEVLSDPKERSWYDSHRSQILFSDPNSSQFSSSSAKVPDLFSYFSNSVFSGFGDTGKGFYKVYGDVFGRVYGQEVWFAKKLGLVEGTVKVAPLIGNLESYYVQVSAFYDYWLGFSSVMDFSWADEHDLREGGDRKARRLMEEENKKLRKKAKREYNDTVRRLAEYLKKRDKRVIDMQAKKKVEQEKKQEKERLRKEEEARAKLEKARMYEEPEWARVEEEEDDDDHTLLEEEEDDSKKSDEELYCVVCKKKFKSDKQWQNHEKSKKHRQKVAEIKNEFRWDEADGKEKVDLSADNENIDMEESNNSRNQEAKRDGVQKSKKEAARVEEGRDTEDADSDSIGAEDPFVEDKSNAKDISSERPVEVDISKRRDHLLDKAQNAMNQRFKRKTTGKGERNTNVRDTRKGDTNTNTLSASNWKAQKGLIVVRGNMPRPPQNLLDQLLLQLKNLEGVIKPPCWVPTVALLACAAVLLYCYYY